MSRKRAAPPLEYEDEPRPAAPDDLAMSPLATALSAALLRAVLENPDVCDGDLDEYGILCLEGRFDAEGLARRLKEEIEKRSH